MDEELAENLTEEVDEDLDECLVSESDDNGHSNDIGQLTYYERPQLREADGLIFIQMDEVKVEAQSNSGRKELWIYTAVVNADGKKFYFSSESGTGLFYQLGSLLAVLDVHKGTREVCVIADGARWIRNWFLNLPIARRVRWCFVGITCKLPRIIIE